MIDTWTLGGCVHVFFFFSHHMLLYTPLFSVVGPLFWKNIKLRSIVKDLCRVFPASEWSFVAEFVWQTRAWDTDRWCIALKLCNLMVSRSYTWLFYKRKTVHCASLCNWKQRLVFLYKVSVSISIWQLLKPKISAKVCTELHTFIEPCQPAWKNT